MSQSATQIRIEELEEQVCQLRELIHGAPVPFPICWHLTAQQEMMLRALYNSASGHMSYEQLLVAIYPGDIPNRDCNPTRGNLHVIMHYLRSKVPTVAFESTVSGYFLSKREKAKITLATAA